MSNNDTDQISNLEPPQIIEVPLIVEPEAAYIDLYTAYAGGCLPEVHPDYHVLTGLVIQAALLGSKLRTTTNLRPNLAGRSAQARHIRASRRIATH